MASSRSPAEILGAVLGKVDSVEGLCALMGRLNEQGAGQLGRHFGRQGEGEMLAFVRGLNGAAPAELDRIAAALNAGRAPTAAGGETPQPAAPVKGKPCARCRETRTDSDLTCPHCGYTDWTAIAAGGGFGVLLLLGAVFGAPHIELPWLQGVVFWGAGGLGALIVLCMPAAVVQGLMAARKRRRAAPAAVPAEADWPRPCVIERACRDRDEAVACSRRLGKFKGVIESVRVSARAGGVVLKVSTRPITRDVYDAIRGGLAG